MVIFSGWGILAFGLAAVIPAVTTIGFSAAMGDPQYYKTHGWPTAVGLWITAVVVWFLGRWLNRVEMREVRDRKTGEVKVVPSGGGHTFFFVPMQYAAVLWFGVGIYMLLNPG